MAWNDVDERCLHCGNITKKAKGFNKQNIKYLLWHKPTFEDWFILGILLLILLMIFSYNHDVAICRNIINNLSAICADYNQAKLYENISINYPEIDLNKLYFKNET